MVHVMEKRNLVEFIEGGWDIKAFCVPETDANPSMMCLMLERDEDVEFAFSDVITSKVEALNRCIQQLARLI